MATGLFTTGSRNPYGLRNKEPNPFVVVPEDEKRKKGAVGINIEDINDIQNFSGETRTIRDQTPAAKSTASIQPIKDVNYQDLNALQKSMYNRLNSPVLDNPFNTRGISIDSAISNGSAGNIGGAANPYSTMGKGSSGGMQLNNTQQTNGQQPMAGGSGIGSMGPSGFGNQNFLTPSQRTVAEKERTAGIAETQNPWNTNTGNAAQDALNAYKNLIKERGGSEADLAAADSAYSDWMNQNAALEEQKANYISGSQYYKEAYDRYAKNIDTIMGSHSEAYENSLAQWEEVVARSEQAVADSVSRANEYLGKIEDLFTKQQDTLTGAKTQALFYYVNCLV